MFDARIDMNGMNWLVTDLQMGQWEEGGEKTRNFSYTIPLNNNIGIKSCRTTEHQVSFIWINYSIILVVGLNERINLRFVLMMLMMKILMLEVIECRFV